MDFTAEQLAQIKVTGRRDATTGITGTIAEDRSLVIAVASETPVRQRVEINGKTYDVWEVLSCRPGAVDLSRVKSGAAVLFNHNKDAHLGKTEDGWADSDLIVRVRMVFGRNPLAEEKRRDVEDKILTKASMGYGECVYERIGTHEDGLPILKAVSWQIHEVSLVTIPADDSVGVNRSLTEATDNRPTSATAASTTSTTMDRKAENQKIRQLRDKYAPFVKAGFDISAEAEKAIDDGKTATEYHELVSSNLGERAKETATIDVGLSKKERAGLSFFRAVRALANKDWRGAEKELEYSNALAKVAGKQARGFYITTADLLRGITVGTASEKGAAYSAVPTELQSETIEFLRAKLWTARAGARVLTGLSGNVDFLRQSGGAVASWVGEGAPAGGTQLGTDLVMLRPKTVCAKTHISRRALIQTDGSIERMQREDLLNALAEAIDTAALLGDGESGKPLGILNTPGVSKIALTGGAVSFKNVLALLAAPETNNASTDSMKWVSSPLVRSLLMSTPKQDGGAEGNFIMTNPKDLLGDEFIPTTIAANNLVRGNFNDLLIGEFGLLDVQVDNDGDTGGIVIRVFADVDVAVRHSKSFAFSEGIDVSEFAPVVDSES